MKIVECSFFITNFCYIFSNVNGIEKMDICSKKILTSFNSRTRNTYCNVRLKIMIMQFFLQIWK